MVKNNLKYLRMVGTVIVLIITVAVFSYYIKEHPAVVSQIKKMDPLSVVLILLLYFGYTIALSAATVVSVLMCGKRLGQKESFNLSASSSIANFFGPLQSGPGVRALYLKKRHGISIKRYGLATLYYYGFYAFFSGLFLISGDQRFRWPLLLLLLSGATFTVYYIRRRSKYSKAGSSVHVQGSNLLKLAFATFIQLSFTAAIYFVELTALGTHVSVAQALSYCGAANFALFVSITPGAIGFREAFLVFSEHLHHIGNTTIVTANLLDRGVYILFLGLIFIWLITSHAQKQFTLHQEGSTK